MPSQGTFGVCGSPFQVAFENLCSSQMTESCAHYLNNALDLLNTRRWCKEAEAVRDAQGRLTIWGEGQTYQQAEPFDFSNDEVALPHESID